MSAPNLLVWRRVFGTRGVHSSICALGVFRTMAAGRRVIITLNDVTIGNHGDLAKARAQADRLIEATAEYFLAKMARVDPTLIPADLRASDAQKSLGDSVPQSAPGNPSTAAEAIPEPGP
jgi:hypothetical protein